MPANPLTRRSFIVRAVSGGFALGACMPSARSQQKGKRPRKLVHPGRVSHEVGAWIIITSEGDVTVRIARADLGQGAPTGLAQLAAEELDCAWDKVRLEFVRPGESLNRGRVWGDFSTSNSRCIRATQGTMREAGAAARSMLLDAAALAWNVPKLELTTDAGQIFHVASGRSSTYAALAESAAKLSPPSRAAIQLKKPSAWRIAGNPLADLGAKPKLTGAAVYGIDVRLPGLLNAAIRAAPVAGGKLSAFDATLVQAMPGVRKVLAVGDDAVAVVADHWWQAKTALDKLEVSWAPVAEDGISSESIAAFLKTGLEAQDAFVGRTHGDALEAMRNAAQTIEAVYSTPFLHHATLEPMNATALWKPDRVEVWVPTQNADAALKTAAEAAGLQPEQAEVFPTLIGGAFGRRLRQDVVRQVVMIAREMPGTPIKLIWSREEDTAHGHYRPVTQARLRGALDDKGEPTGLIMRISGQSILTSNLARTASGQAGRDPRMFQGLHAQPGEAQMGYSIANVYIDHAMRNTHLPVGSWRGVHTTQNGVYLECFIDELAFAAKKDPLEFRSNLMKGHPLHLAVLVAAATRAGWGTAHAEGLHRGLAQMMAVGSYAAAVAEVAVSPEGEVRVARVVVALDCGTLVNPQLVEAQVQGAVVMATSATVGEEITIKAGRVVEKDFDAYPLLRLARAPHVDTVLVPSGDFWGGVGEAAMGAVAPAILNAIFAATGKRVRALPLKNAKLKP